MKRINLDRNFPRFNRAVLLLVFVLLLRLCGQTAAGYSGRYGSFFNIYTLISYCCMFLRAVLWMLVLKELPLTVAYPFSGLTFLLIIPLSALLFDETPAPGRVAGAVLIFCGIAFTAAGAVRNES